MHILVQKFGGTSVQNENNRSYVIKQVKDALEKGYKALVVVSAIGRKPNPYATDTLLELIKYPSHFNSKRELDMLLSCGETISSIVLSNELQQHQIRTTALTGSQAGIITNENFNEAKIIKIKPARIMKEFETNDVIVVAGFQGQTADGEVTTIGRGGSDTTAVALGVTLQTDHIEIFTDVNGIMTADPNIVTSAKTLEHITYTEVFNLAYQGAKIIHPIAVEMAMQAKIPIRVRSTYLNSQGTLIAGSTSSRIDDRLITGIAHLTNISQIQVQTNHQLQSQSSVFKTMAEHGISLDFINISTSNIVFTVPAAVTENVIQLLEKLGHQPRITKHCSKVSVIGSGMTGVPGVAAKIVKALVDKNIPILQSADSHTTIWVLVLEKNLDEAVNALHDIFNLNK